MPHPAMARGITTAAAMGAFAKGMLPICLHRDCSHNDINWQDPFFLKNMREKTNFLAYVPNGWGMSFFLPYADEELKKKNLKWHENHENLPSEEMVDDFIERDLDNYFAYFHLMEPHPPFFHPDWKGMSPGEISDSPETPNPPTRRKMAVEWADENVVGRLLEQDYDELVVTSDHPLDHPGDEEQFVESVKNGRPPQKHQVFLTTDRGR